METLDAIAAMIERDGSSKRAISERMGKSPNYLASTIEQAKRKNGDARAATLAALAAATGHRLAAVPVDDVPASALVIDPPSNA